MAICITIIALLGTIIYILVSELVKLNKDLEVCRAELKELHEKLRQK